MPTYEQEQNNIALADNGKTGGAIFVLVWNIDIESQIVRLLPIHEEKGTIFTLEINDEDNLKKMHSLLANIQHLADKGAITIVKMPLDTYNRALAGNINANIQKNMSDARTRTIARIDEEEVDEYWLG